MNKFEKIKIFRERFFGRQDIYGRQWKYVGKDGKQIVGYAPQCDNFWTPSCHIKNKTGVACAKCEIKKHAPVSDESVWAHITGEEKQIQYLVFDNATIKFGAIDFDCKPGKESQGHNFDDVKLVSAVLTEEGIPHGIARSTTAGYHLYVFFSEFYSAYRFRCFLAHYVFERVGFNEQVRQGIRGLPEMFPKQDYVGFGPGNGICPSTIEPRWDVQRNGFVDGNDNFIPPEQQWEYLASIPLVTPEVINAAIERNGVEIDESVEASNADATRRILNKKFSSKGKWEQPLSGSFEKVIEGCAAMRRIFEKASAGTVPGHQEGFAAFHLAMQCVDGIGVFKDRMTGWGGTDRDWAQLQHSVDKGYSPWTCKKMQEHGVCTPGTKCFEKKPPITVVEGRYVPLTDIPESEWPEPGPIRFAYGRGEDFLEKLKREVDELVEETDEIAKGNKIRDIAKRAQVFDGDQQRVLRDYAKTKKIIKANDLSKMFNKASGEYNREMKDKASSRSDTVCAGRNLYQILEPKGYAILKLTKEGQVFERISNCVIEIEEERNYIDEDISVKSVYKGRLISDRINTPFEVDQDSWWDNNRFMTYFGKIGGSNFNVVRDDISLIRQASLAFSERRGIQKHNHLVTQGWYQNTYLMPSTLVDRDGIRPNTEKVIDLSHKPHASFLDFKILSHGEFQDLCFHLVNDFLNAWPRQWTFIALGHAFLPALINPLGLRKKPSLFLEGLTGSGKTELLHTAQFFWGEFDSIVNLSSTGKGLMAVAHDFKDCLLVLDDYKGLDHSQLLALQRVIQYSYDPNIAVKLSRDSSIMRPKSTRGIIAFTGEHFLENEAAMLARTILLEVDKQDTSRTKEKYLRCIKMRKMYNGFTPRFIHWFLQQDTTMVMEDLKKIQNIFHEKNGKLQNADRISYNLALNHLTLKLFFTFMCECGVITNVKPFLDEHLGYIGDLVSDLLLRCGEEQNGNVFLKVLRQLISCGEVIIKGLNDDDEKINKPIIGYMDKTSYGLSVCNILPEAAFKMVKNNTRDSPIRGTMRDLARQFAHDGLLVGLDTGRNQKQVYWRSTRVYVWPFNAHKLGIYIGTMDSIQGGREGNISPQDQPIPSADGVF